MDTNYIEILKESVNDKNGFVRAVLSGKRRGIPSPWKKIVLRPVIVRGEYHIQFSYFDEKKDVSKNYKDGNIEIQLNTVADLPFKNILIQMRDRDIHMLIGNKGNVTMSTKKHTPVTIEPVHNREKQRLLTPENAAAFLEKVGLASKTGEIKAGMQRKYLQINEYLKLLNETEYFSRTISQREINIVDLGCGNAYLTFATYHFVVNILGLRARLVGVDVNKELINRNNSRARELGWDNLSFEVSKIAAYIPQEKPEVVIALHACDTATDDAIARGIQWESQLIVTAPCCHHHIQAQLTQQPPPHAFRSMMRQAILRERFGDILTDTLRALILRIMGYKTDIIEFIATEHTPRNLMIRSVRVPAKDVKAVEEYHDLKSMWKVTPYLESLLGADCINSPLRRITTDQDG